jgi:hypothetical protein
VIEKARTRPRQKLACASSMPERLVYKNRPDIFPALRTRYNTTPSRVKEEKWTTGRNDSFGRRLLKKGGAENRKHS